MTFSNFVKDIFNTAESVIIILISLAVIAWFLGVFALIYNCYYGKKLSSQLRKNKVLWKRRSFFWEPLTLLRTLNPPIWSEFNPIKSFKEWVNYIFNKEDTNDPAVLFYKKKLRVGYKTLFISFATFVVLLLTVLIIFIISGGRVQ